MTLELLVEASDYIVSVDSLVEMERWSFSGLNYDINNPTRYYFLTRFAIAAKLTPTEVSHQVNATVPHASSAFP